MIPERLIFFDEPTHKYTDQYGNYYVSVTTSLSEFHDHFDADYWAARKAAELGTSANVMKNQWKAINKDSTNNGNKKHNAIETGIKGTSKFEKAVKIITTSSGIVRCFSIYDLAYNPATIGIGEMSLTDFYNKIGHKYHVIYDTIKYYVNKGYRIFSEITVYDPINLICGTIDCLLVKDEDFVIIDWKTNRNEIKFEPGYYKKDKATQELTNEWVPKISFMKYPIDNLYDCVGTHYSLQLSMYATMVEQFGFNLVAMILFHIRDHYILNKWGQPAKDSSGKYIKDTEKGEYVNYHLISYLKGDVDRVRVHVGMRAKPSFQQKIIME